MVYCIYNLLGSPNKTGIVLWLPTSKHMQGKGVRTSHEVKAECIVYFNGPGIRKYGAMQYWVICTVCSAF